MKIKFRVWDKVEKTMKYFDYGIFNRLPAGAEDLTEPMQYTGLKDKTGKAIYEGDICNCREFECYGKIEWNNEEAGFYFYILDEDGLFEEECLYGFADELEVIGNVYDNPELLRECK